jgi:hypothetical protein
MAGPWELLDKTANVIEVGYFIGRFAVASYKIYKQIYKHRDKLRRLVSRSRELTGGGIQSHASLGGGKLIGTARGRSSASGVLSVSYPKKLSAVEELLWWYSQVR